MHELILTDDCTHTCYTMFGVVHGSPSHHTHFILYLLVVGIPHGPYFAGNVLRKYKRVHDVLPYTRFGLKVFHPVLRYITRDACVRVYKTVRVRHAMHIRLPRTARPGKSFAFPHRCARTKIKNRTHTYNAFVSKRCARVLVFTFYSHSEHCTTVFPHVHSYNVMRRRRATIPCVRICVRTIWYNNIEIYMYTTCTSSNGIL